MPFCLNCPTKNTCKEICPEVEALLPKPRSGGHKKEKSHSPTHLAEIMDKISGQKYTCGGGKRSQPVIYED